MYLVVPIAMAIVTVHKAVVLMTSNFGRPLLMRPPPPLRMPELPNKACPLRDLLLWQLRTQMSRPLTTVAWMPRRWKIFTLQSGST